MISSRAHVFVGDLEELRLEPDDDHHLRRVLRLHTGEVVTASDGHGGLRPCVWTGEDAPLRAEGAVERVARPTPEVGVGFALTKGDRPEWVTQKLTEAGVDRIMPFVAERSVARWDAEKAARQAARLTRVAREAAMQSRRLWLPTVEPLTSFDELVGPGSDDLALAQPGGARPSLERPVLLVGPEGGFAEGELRAGVPTVDLGPTVLRSETAAVAAGLILAWLRAGIVQTPPN